MLISTNNESCFKIIWLSILAPKILLCTYLFLLHNKAMNCKQSSPHPIYKSFSLQPTMIFPVGLDEEGENKDKDSYDLRKEENVIVLFLWTGNATFQTWYPVSSHPHTSLICISKKIEIPSTVAFNRESWESNVIAGSEAVCPNR